MERSEGRTKGSYFRQVSRGVEVGEIVEEGAEGGLALEAHVAPPVIELVKDARALAFLPLLRLLILQAKLRHGLGLRLAPFSQPP